MPNSLLLRILSLVLPFAALPSLTSAQVTPAQPIIITHVTVINPATSSVEPDRTVIVTGEQITAVVDAAHFRVPARGRLINGRGQYLLPGLWDMHVHSAFGNWFPGGGDIILPLFIANGVTGVRDMGSVLAEIRRWQGRRGEEMVSASTPAVPERECTRDDTLSEALYVPPLPISSAQL